MRKWVEVSVESQPLGEKETVWKYDRVFLKDSRKELSSSPLKKTKT